MAPHADEEQKGHQPLSTGNGQPRYLADLFTGSFSQDVSGVIHNNAVVRFILLMGSFVQFLLKTVQGSYSLITAQYKLGNKSRVDFGSIKSLKPKF